MMQEKRYCTIDIEKTKIRMTVADKVFYQNPHLSLLKSIPFVGLKDKNGAPIHFGDILKDEFDNLLTPVCEISNDEHVLFFKPLKHLDKSFCIGCKSTYSHTLEIVSKGNLILNFAQESCNIDMSK